MCSSGAIAGENEDKGSAGREGSEKWREARAGGAGQRRSEHTTRVSVQLVRVDWFAVSQGRVAGRGERRRRGCGRAIGRGPREGGGGEGRREDRIE